MPNLSTKFDTKKVLEVVYKGVKLLGVTFLSLIIVSLVFRFIPYSWLDAAGTVHLPIWIVLPVIFFFAGWFAWRFSAHNHGRLVATFRGRSER